MQALRGLLFALVLFSLRKRFLELIVRDGIGFAGIIFIVGFVATSGRMLERFVCFREYPVKFALITFVEILIQVTIMGLWTVNWMKQARVA